MKFPSNGLQIPTEVSEPVSEIREFQLVSTDCAYGV